MSNRKINAINGTDEKTMNITEEAVNRAVAARAKAGVEISEHESDQVNGGLQNTGIVLGLVIQKRPKTVVETIIDFIQKAAGTI